MINKNLNTLDKTNYIDSQLENSEITVKQFNFDDLKSELYHNILEYQIIYMQILITTIFLASQYQFIPILYGKLTLQLDKYQIILIIFSISFLIGISWFIRGIEQENLQTDKLLRINTISQKFIKQLRISKEKQSFGLLISCKKRIDILKCQALNPKQFLIDQIECIKQNIVTQLNFLDNNNRNQLIDLIDTNVQKNLQNRFSSNNENIDLKNFITKLKDVYLNDIIYLTDLDEGILIDYYQFKNLLEDFEVKYKLIKKNNIFCESYHHLRHFKSINNSNLETKRSNKINVSDKISLFENTIIINLAKLLKDNNDQDKNVDNVINTLQQENFSSNILDVRRIYGLIEGKEKVNLVSTSLNNNEFISNITIDNQTFSMNVRQATDKTADNIRNKVQRKHVDLIPNNIPWSIKLIKDWKRMSIVLKSELEIFLFVQNKKKLFGDDYSQELFFPNERIQIRISEIKNGQQAINSEEDQGNYRDLKIIYEIMVVELDISFQIECQVNLENLIIYKKVDHILYDIERAKEEQEIIKSQQARQQWMEGNTRLFLQILRIIMILIAISSIGISIILVVNDINLRLKTIWHANERISVKFIEGHYPNNICQTIDNQAIHCVGFTKINTLIEKSNFQHFNKLISNGDSIIGIDYQNDFLKQNLNDYRNINIDDNIFEVKQNYNLICQQNNRQISCIHKKVQKSLISAYLLSTCITANNNMACWGDIADELKEIPVHFTEGVDLLSAGLQTNCASKEDLFLCWGVNNWEQMDTPDEFKSGVDLLSVGYFNVCAGVSDLVLCWGQSLADSQMFQEDQGDEDYFSLANVPDEIRLGAEMLKVGFQNACGIKLGLMYCWGWNKQGINDIPNGWESGISLFAISQFQLCAFKNSLRCWGQDLQGIGQFPIDGLMNVMLMEMNDKLMCVVNEEAVFQCWGDGLSDHLDQEQIQQIEGIHQIAVGTTHVCVSSNHLVKCFADDKDLQDVDENMKLNWSLPSIQYKLTNVQHGQNLLCIFKGSLLCQSISSDNSINLIFTPIEAQKSNQFKSKKLGICAVNDIGKLLCWSLNLNINEDLPSVFNSNTVLFDMGIFHMCATTVSLIECWGDNQVGQTDIPEPLVDVVTLGIGNQATCASTSTRLICWGAYIFADDVYLDEVPEHLRDGVGAVEVGVLFACAIQTGRLQCWGRNANGATDTPDQFNGGSVGMMSVGDSHACAQKQSVMRCWGSIFLTNRVPAFIGNKGLDYINSCIDTNCGKQDGEWICWGEYSIPYRLQVSELDSQGGFDNNYDVADEQNICMTQTGNIECRHQFERLGIEIKADPSFLCMQIDVNRPQICQVDQNIKSKFACILSSKYEQLEYQNRNEQTGDSNVIKLSCGTNHGCALFESGEVHCFGGSEEQKESDLSKEMMEGAQDIRAGQNSTCILTTSQIICTGKDIDIKQGNQNLVSLEGFDQILKFN